MAYFNDPQVEQLLRGVNPKRVHNLKGLSYMEAYDIRAHLNRVFGFARWSADVISMEQIYERFHKNSKGNDAVSVGYRAGLTLTVCAPDGELLATYTEYAAGSASGFPITKHADAHDMAIKTAESQALKRAAINLGDQFGLSLYQNGSRNPLVGKVLNIEPEGKEDVTEGVPEVVPESDQPEVNPDWITLIQEAGTKEEAMPLWYAARDAGVPQEVLDEMAQIGQEKAA